MTIRLAVETRKADRFQPVTLVDTITELKGEFNRIQGELSQARDEISRLKRKLNSLRPLSKAMAEVDIDALRRKAAYYCHPDRGGDGDLMTFINVLLDVFETENVRSVRSADMEKGIQ